MRDRALEASRLHRRTKARGAITSAVTLAAVAMAVVLSASTACLEGLPETTRCPPNAEHAYCPPAALPALPALPTGRPALGGQCVMRTDACITQQYGTCECGDAECPASPGRCFPPPDCPPAIRAAHPASRCLEVHVTTAVQPTAPDAQAPLSPGAAAPPVLPCTCGCARCAEVCDGRGPILGPAGTLRVDLQPMPASGSLGLMLRARGVGRLTVSPVRTGALPPGDDALLSFTVNLASLEDLSSDHAGALLSAMDGPMRIDHLTVSASDDAQVEIDCVVPFVLP